MYGNAKPRKVGVHRSNYDAGMMSPDGSNRIVTTAILAGPEFADRRGPILSEVVRVPVPVRRGGFGAPTTRRELRCDGRPGPEFQIGSNPIFHTAETDPASAALGSRVHVGPRHFGRPVLREARVSRGTPCGSGRQWSGRRRCGLPLPAEAICDRRPATPELRNAALCRNHARNFFE